MEIAELAHHIELAPSLARWHVDEWSHLYHDWTFDAAVAELAAMTTPGRIPTTYVAFAGGGRDVDDVLGSVSLIDDDELGGWRDVGPWLASVYIVPTARGRGVGRALTRLAVEHAAALGVGRLHLFTAGQEAYYAALGWRVIGRARAGDEDAAVMAIGTAPTAARRAVASRWCTDPDIATAYSYLRPGGSPDDRDVLAEPLAPGLVLAGEATWREHPGTMHGAWFSGERAAALVTGSQRGVVVGAGLAGIAAARALHDAGTEVVVLEAGATIGGRVRTDTTLGCDANLGAAWTHGDVGNPIAAAAQALGIGGDATVWSRIETYVVGRGRVDARRAWRLYDVAERRITAAAAGAAPGDALGPVADRVLRAVTADADADTRLLVDAFVRAEYENLYAAPLDDLSLAHCQEAFRLPGEDTLVLGSLGDVVAALADGLDVRCGARATAIQRNDAGWRVVVENGDAHDADAVVVTVPIGVLHAGRIRFDPPLPAAVLAAASHIGAGRVAKVFATFDEVFWGRAGAFYVAGDPSERLSLWVDATGAMGRPALCAFATGDDALAVEAMTEDELCTLVDAVLARAGVPSPAVS